MKRPHPILFLATALYFSEGFPYGVFAELFPIYLRAEGVSLASIGFMTSLGYAWTLKFFWAPAVDLFGSYRAWIATAVAAIAGALAVMAINGIASWWLFVAATTVLAFASATQDIAIDASAIRLTPANLLGPVNSIRITAYRGAMIVAGGAVAIIGSRYGWRTAFLAAAAVMAALFLIVLLTMPRLERNAATHTNPFTGLAQWLQRPSAILLLLLVLLYKMGDAALTPMTKPFWIDRGYTAAQVGAVTTILGVSMIIAGAIVGGICCSRFGLYPSLIWLGVSQILSNVVYAIAAHGFTGIFMFYTAAVVEAFTYGLGTAAFLALLMAICDKEHAATEYAMLSAIFALSRTTVGTFSGVAAETLGYAGYFWLTVFLGIPGLLLVRVVRDSLRERTERAAVSAVLEG